MSQDPRIRVRVLPEELERYQAAFEEWAVYQQIARCYFSDWVRFALECQADRDLGDTRPASKGTSRTRRDP